VLAITQTIRGKQLAILNDQRKRADGVDRFSWWLVLAPRW